MPKKESKTLTPEEIERESQRILKKMKDEGITLQQATGIPDSFLEEMYALAHAHYERGNYKESLSLFQFLAGCSPQNYKFMLGLAANLHQMGEYTEALQGFMVALKLDESNPTPIYYMADCFLRLGDEESAIPLYESMVEAGKIAPEFKELADKSKLIVDGYKRNKKSR
ncbi:MAG: hypothetical protein S4CHLAM81_15330 [Chlamydiales bacterium]|nr:hypothetical protein [Chlamydiales bacterium]MCH9636302.1 hypothetical protein [Chlamydiales bacterium]MCH9703967.1 SycD/LcrH family type III secretion system chaperone [Chlamydiota bacterium]